MNTKLIVIAFSIVVATVGFYLYKQRVDVSNNERAKFIQELKQKEFKELAKHEAIEKEKSLKIKKRKITQEVQQIPQTKSKDESKSTDYNEYQGTRQELSDIADWLQSANENFSRRLQAGEISGSEVENEQSKIQKEHQNKMRMWNKAVSDNAGNYSDSCD